jgi:hypothetical protein
MPTKKRALQEARTFAGKGAVLVPRFGRDRQTP